MNIYFIDPEGIRKTAWEHFKAILKVKMVFSFLPDSEVGHLRKCFPDVPFIAKPEDMPNQQFSEACVFEMADYIKNTHVNRSKPEDTFCDRGSNPVYNLVHFGYENILFLGHFDRTSTIYSGEEDDRRDGLAILFEDIVQKHSQHVRGNQEWIYNPDTGEEEPEGWESYTEVDYADRASGLFRHLKNLLMKQLGLTDDIFSKRIPRCGFYDGDLLYQHGPDKHSTHYWWNYMKSHDLSIYIRRELHKVAPADFFCVKYDNRIRYSSFFNSWETHIEQCEKDELPAGVTLKDFVMQELPPLVDLGLSSGTLWCDRNLGAKNETDCGFPYRWGERLPDMFDKEYDYCGSRFEDLKRYYNDFKYQESFERYLWPSEIFYLEPECDAAWFSSLGLLRIPTEAQYLELFEECRWDYAVQDGVKGIIFYGDEDSSLFLPLDSKQDDVTKYWVSNFNLELLDDNDEGEHVTGLELNGRTYEIAKFLARNHGFIRPVFNGSK